MATDSTRGAASGQDETLYFYRQRENSISSILGERYLDLVLGLESRLKFITEYYPDLTNIPEHKDAANE